MSSNIPDPIALLPYQTGLIVTPLQETAAAGQDMLDSRQRSIVIGEPVPIVFCRRVSNIGGVFVSPGATEGRYINNATTNELTVRLQLVLSEGDLPQLQLRDVFQRACRVGTWKQSYDARTSNWAPGNFTTVVSGKEPWDCPAFCGTGGSYDNMTTLSYTNTHADGDETWDKQVHCFVREGMEVTRILDDTLGPSNNLIDLALYLINQSSRLPSALIDLAEMENAADFTDTNGFYYNGIFDQSTNLEEWMEQISTQFLLRITDKNGKKAFRPRLPFSGAAAIDTTAVTWVYTFTEDHVVPDGFEISYIPLAERKPICAQMIWRQQPDSDIGLIRTTEVRFAGEAPNGPYEQYDLSQFCASELHAVKVGAYYVARRKFITHTLRLRVRPVAFENALALGDLVRVKLKRETDVSDIAIHDYLYEVERINRNIEGIIELDLTHFPINSAGQSILALVVNGATAPAYTMPTGRGDFTCDIAGRSSDTTPLDSDPYNDPNLPEPDDFEYEIPDTYTEAPPNVSNLVEEPENPPDPYDGPAPEGGSISGNATVGSTLTANNVCPGSYIEWWRCPTSETDAADVSLNCTRVSEGSEQFTYTVTGQDPGYYIIGIGRCPDESTPSGYGEPFVIGSTDIGDDWNVLPSPTTMQISGTETDVVGDLIACYNTDPSGVGAGGIIIPGGTYTTAIGTSRSSVIKWRTVGPSEQKNGSILACAETYSEYISEEVFGVEFMYEGGNTEFIPIMASNYRESGPRTQINTQTAAITVTPAP